MKEKTNNNMSGKGGFKDNPGNINRKGRPPEHETIRYHLRNESKKLYKDVPVKLSKEVLAMYTIEQLNEMTLGQILAINRLIKGIAKADDQIITEIDGEQPKHIMTEDITVHVPDQQEQQRMMNKFKYDIPPSKEEEGEDKIQ